MAESLWEKTKRLAGEAGTVLANPETVARGALQGPEAAKIDALKDIASPILGSKAQAFAVDLNQNSASLMPASTRSKGVADQLREIDRYEPFVQKVARVWKTDEGILDRMTRDLKDQKLVGRFQKIMDVDSRANGMDVASAALDAYAGKKKSIGQIIYDAEEKLKIPHPGPTQAELNAAAERKAAEARRLAAARAERDTSKPPTVKPTAREKPAPIAATVREPAADANPPSTNKSPPAQPETSETQNDGKFTPSMAKRLSQGLGVEVANMYRDTDGKSPLDDRVQALKDKLDPTKNPDTAPAFQKQIADAINNDPELLARLNSGEGSGGLFPGYGQMNEQGKKAYRDAMQPTIERLLDNPALIADPAFKKEASLSIIGKIPVTAELVGMEGGIADQLADRLLKTFPEDSEAIKGFRTKLKGDKQLQSQIADNMNKNPEFVEQLIKFSAQKDGESDKLLKQFGRPVITDLLAHPEKLAQDSYVDSLTSKLSTVGGAGGGFGGMMGQLWEGIKEMFGPLIQKVMAACQEMFGGGNGMSMFSGIGDGVSGLFSNLMGPDGAFEGVTGKRSEPVNISDIDKDDGSQIQTLSPEKKAEQERLRSLQNGPRQTQQDSGPQQLSPATGPASPAATAASALG